MSDFDAVVELDRAEKVYDWCRAVASGYPSVDPPPFVREFFNRDVPSLIARAAELGSRPTPAQVAEAALTPDALDDPEPTPCPYHRYAMVDGSPAPVRCVVVGEHDKCRTTDGDKSVQAVWYVPTATDPEPGEFRRCPGEYKGETFRFGCYDVEGHEGPHWAEDEDGDEFRWRNTTDPQPTPADGYALGNPDRLHGDPEVGSR